MAGKKGKSGRKADAPIDYDKDFKDTVCKIVGELEQEQGKPFIKAIFEMIYDEKTQDTVKASLFKTYSEIFATKKTESKIEDATKEPKIYIPEMDKED